MPLPKEKQRYTNEDYWSWSEDDRIEIIDGVAYYTYGGMIEEGAPVMQATPSLRHQAISVELSGQLREFLTGRQCRLFTAPAAVALNVNTGDDTTVEPDLFVVCDSSKLDGKRCNGAPDLVIEILSPSTARKDRVVKFQLYQKALVPEYWIIDPEDNSLHACVLDQGRYYVTAYDETNGDVSVAVLKGCSIDLRKVFSEEN